MQLKTLTVGRGLLYSLGHLGWWTLLNIINMQLVFFYLPPEVSGLPQLITSHKIFGIFNAIVLIAAGGRLIEAITDPLLAGYSDRSRFKLGRRIPLMAVGFIPAALFCYLMFSPPESTTSSTNLYWLIVTQALFYPFFSMYAMPHNALLVELSRTPKERIRLATFLSMMNALASLVAALVPLFAVIFVQTFQTTAISGFRYSIGALCVFSALCMLAPLLAIRERDYLGAHPEAHPTHEPILESLKTTFKNPRFLRFGLADCAYWTGLNIITTGMMYYLTVLLGLTADMLTLVMLVLILGAFAWMPLVNRLARSYPRRKLVEYAFIAFAAVFGLVYFLGKLPMPPKTQAIVLALLASVPFSFLGILPTTILADLTDHDALKSGTRREGMFFAARTMLMKLGQTFGIILFTTLLNFGKEVDNDLGIRLTGIAGVVLCLAAAWILRGYDEESILSEIKNLKSISNVQI